MSLETQQFGAPAYLAGEQTDCDVRLLLPDLMGVARGKYLRGNELHKDSRFAAAMYLIGHDVDPQPLAGFSGESGFPDVIVRAEPQTLQPGWRPGERIVLGSSFTESGDPFPFDPRHGLRRVVAAWEQLGLTPWVAMELEFFVLEADGDGGWQPARVPGARPYGTGPDVDPLGIAPRLLEAAHNAGITIEGLSSEFFAGQFELNLGPKAALAACDELFLLRLLVREVVHDMGLKATFMPRPFDDRGGNGLHVNVSFANVDGGNALDDPSTPDGLAPMTVNMVGGLLDNHRRMAALLAPTVNSYKRLRPDLLCGYYADWGYDNRFVTVRIPGQRGAQTRFEARQGDASGCPHLSVATLLAAALDGLRNGTTPPPPRDGAEPQDGSAVMPATLGEALDELDAGAPGCFEELLGTPLLDAFKIVRRHEWTRFTQAVVTRRPTGSWRSISRTTESSRGRARTASRDGVRWRSVRTRDRRARRSGA